MSATKPHRFRFGAFELDASTGDLQRDGVSVRLQERPLRLLLILIGHAGSVVTREQLYQQLWSDRTAADAERAPNPLVKQLRDALNDPADNPVFIHTIPRRGYQFLAAVEPLPVDTAAVGARPIVAGGSGETTAHVPARLPPTRHRSRAIYVVLSVLAVLGVALWCPRHASRETGARQLPRGNQARLAVLPFDDLTGDDRQFFADGLHEETIVRLGRLQPRRLAVIARTSVLAYRGASKNIATIARELGVDYVLEGSVRRANDRFQRAVPDGVATPRSQVASFRRSKNAALASITLLAFSGSVVS